MLIWGKIAIQFTPYESNMKSGIVGSNEMSGMWVSHNFTRSSVIYNKIKMITVRLMI